MERTRTVSLRDLSIVLKHAERLAEYETGNYRPGACRMVYPDSPADELKADLLRTGVCVSVVGNMNDLSERKFDLGVWLKSMGRGTTVGSDQGMSG